MIMLNQKAYFQKGFTLIELLLVVAIIGILAAMAYPSYTESIRKGNRRDVQSQMLQVAQQLENYKFINFSYVRVGTSATDGYPSLTSNFPTSGKSLYNLVIVPTASDWSLTATPLAPPKPTVQTGDGTIVLNSYNQRCWVKGGTCTPTATTNWDGK